MLAKGNKGFQKTFVNLEAEMRKDAGRGVKLEPQHNVTWVHEDWAEHSPRYQAFEAVDRLKDLRPLIEELRATGDPFHRCIANVMERCELKAKNPIHRPRALGHKLTFADAKLFVAINAAKAMVKDGWKVDRALAVVAKESDLRWSTLDHAYHGRRRKKK
jgi:hypothetical protein